MSGLLFSVFDLGFGRLELVCEDEDELFKWDFSISEGLVLFAYVTRFGVVLEALGTNRLAAESDDGGED